MAVVLLKILYSFDSSGQLAISLPDLYLPVLGSDSPWPVGTMWCLGIVPGVPVVKVCAPALVSKQRVVKDSLRVLVLHLPLLVHRVF